jgi:hypothetical protein
LKAPLKVGAAAATDAEARAASATTAMKRSLGTRLRIAPV